MIDNNEYILDESFILLVNVYKAFDELWIWQIYIQHFGFGNNFLFNFI